MIVATLGRVNELDRFLNSIDKQNGDKSIFEVIVVDQNDDGRLDNLIIGYKNLYSIVHLKINKTGTSYARNYGIAFAKGQYIAFPDDDCMYYPDFMGNFQLVVNLYNSPELIIARIYDRTNNRSLIKSFPSKQKKIFIKHFYQYGSAIVMITKLRIYFDEDFGPGAQYFSNEDPEYLLRLINATTDGYGFYNPALQVWHEESCTRTVSLSRAWKYGIGLGAMFRKHLSLSRLVLFLILITHSFLKSIFSIVLLRKGAFQYFVSTLSRISGFFVYRHR